MDPRHPEQAISRMRELMEQYDRIENDMRKITVATDLGRLEREGSLVIQEICLVAPRLHEAMMQTSRQRRNELSRGIAFGYIPEEKVGKYIKATIGIEEKSVKEPVEDNADVIGEENIGGESGPMEMPHDGYLSVDEAIEKNPTPSNEAETVFVEPKPRKKTTKKKITKKAKE